MMICRRLIHEKETLKNNIGKKQPWKWNKHTKQSHTKANPIINKNQIKKNPKHS